MPAAAVIPAPRVSMVNAAVKGSVVDECLMWGLKQRLLGCYYDATDGENWIVGREVKCADPDWTNGGEGGFLGRM